MQDGSSTEKTRAPRWMKVLLGVSLAVNLAVVGAVVGATARHDNGPSWGRKSPSLSAFGAPYMLALPREERRAIRRVLRSSDDRPVPTREMRREMYTDVLNALRATPFQPERLEDAVRMQTDASVSVQSAVKAEWLRIVANMSDEARTDYAMAVEDVLKRGPKRR